MMLPRGTLAMTHDDFIVWGDLAVIPLIIGTVWFLFIVLARKWVKNDIIDRGCQPIRVRWTIFSWCLFTDPHFACGI